MNLTKVHLKMEILIQNKTLRTKKNYLHMIMQVILYDFDQTTSFSNSYLREKPLQ
mgnify:CR=1 FL=1